MSIPTSCTALVIGGGPAGSLAASVLAREGVDVVLLEADIFPRYHIGESMLASIRHFFRFIDLKKTFDEYGFEKKLYEWTERGVVFKLNNKRAAFTDFVAANEPNGYAWNVVRAESDELIFRHAAKCGAQVFDGVKVTAIEFASIDSTSSVPVDGSATLANSEKRPWAGRPGVYQVLQKPEINQGLKNIANWGYWHGAGMYAPGTEQENQPFFEALADASGWCWAIPLHNGTMSVGIVMRQDLFVAKKKALTHLSGPEVYRECLNLAPQVHALLANAELVSEVKSASDWSYSADSYASPYLRLAGDAGCFIDPYFSSGVHLALASGLSAAMTIQASRRGDLDETEAAKWHSAKVTEGYTRFLLVVMTALKQIQNQTEPVLSDFDEDGFDTAFKFFRPIIQGTVDADVDNRLTQSEVSKTVGFCLNAFKQSNKEQRQAVLDKVKSSANGEKADLANLSEDELQILHTIRARQMLSAEDCLTLKNFGRGVVDGIVPRLKQGGLTLLKVEESEASQDLEFTDLFEFTKHSTIVAVGLARQL
ncbi:NAD(P)/FAD-dependent oxidoreductase [Aspergillus stella-maris]|uniref:NAD(P)/FAD-dependent oxidoreductase n=1 Tax=Aspergillus stella-maris TaxID=1810926 RepID=UPI003CCD102D